MAVAADAAWVRDAGDLHLSGGGLHPPSSPCDPQRMVVIPREVRTRVETSLALQLAGRSPPLRSTVDADGVRRTLRGDAVLLSAHLVPSLHETVLQARQRLSTEAVVEIWQGAARPHEWDGVFIHPVCEPIVAELRGPILAELDATERLALLGTIFGHGLAHGPGSLEGDIHHDLQDRPGPTRARFEIAAGVTVDRYALIAARDPRAVIRLRLLLATGLAAGSLSADLDSMSVEWTARVEGALAAGRAADPSTESLAVRGWAIERFAGSDLYHSITGLGPATERFDDLEDELAALLMEETSAVPLSAPSAPEEAPAESNSFRDTLTRATAAVAVVAGQAAPGIRRASHAIASRVGRLVESRRRRDDDPSPEQVEALDEVLRDDAEDDLLARFAELERRSKGGGDGGSDGER